MAKDLPTKNFKSSPLPDELSSVNTQTTSTKGEEQVVLPDSSVPGSTEAVNKNTADSFRGFLLAAYKSLSNNAKAIKLIKVTVILYLLIYVILPPVIIMIAFLTFPDATARFFNFPVQSKLSLQNDSSHVLGESISSTTGGNPITGYVAEMLKPNAQATVQTLRAIRPETVSGIVIPADQANGPPSTPSNTTPNTPPATGPPGSPGEAGSQGPAGIKGVEGVKGEIGIAGSQGLVGQTGPAGPTGVPGSLGSLSTGNGLSGNISGGNLSLNLALSSSGATTTTNNTSGLETTSSGVSLLKGCSNNQVLSWNSAASEWQCSTASTGMVSLNGLTTSAQTFSNDTNVAITSSGSTHALSWNGLLPVSRGGIGAGTLTSNGLLFGNGTGVVQTTSAPSSGQLLIGNGSGVPIFTTLSGDGSLSSGGVFTLANSAVASGSYGSGTSIPTFMVDSKGRLTLAGNTSITSGNLINGTGLSATGTLTGRILGSTDVTLNVSSSVPTSVVGDTNITGSIAANTLTLGWSGALASNRGGTGLSATPTNGQLLIGNGTGYTMAGLTAGSNISITNGSGSITVNTSQTPTFTSVNGLTITNTGSNTLTIAAGKTLTANNSLTFAGTDATSFTFPGSSDTVVGRSSTDTLSNKTISAGSNTLSGLTNANLSGSAGITNANLANSTITFSGDSGSSTTALGSTRTIAGSGIVTTAVSGNTLTITGTEADTLASITGRGATTSTPAIFNGGLTVSSVNGLAITSTTGALTIANGKTFTANNSLGLSGTDGTSFTLPAGSDTLVGRSSTDTLSNKTISASSNTVSGLTNANLSGTAGITNANLANSSMTITSGTGLSGGGTLSLGGSLTLTNSGVTSLTGTANQVNVSGSTGGITLSLPQNIGIGATPAFSGLTLSSLGTGVVHSNSSGVLSSSAVNLASDVSGTLPIGSGGTNITTYILGDMLYASAANILSKLGIGSAGQVLTVTGGVPAWQTVSSGAAFSSLTAASAANTIDNTNFAQTWNWSTANTGNTLTISANSLTSGNGLIISSTSTSLTGNLLQVTSGSTAAFTNGGVRFNFTGAHTGNGVQVDDVTATGTVAKITGNSLTTGTELLVTTSNNSLNSTNGLVTISNTGTSTNGTILKVQASSANTNALVVNANGNTGFGIAPVSTSRLAMNGLAAAASGNVSLCIPSGGSGAIFQGGSATSCNTSSARYKHDIAALDDNLGLQAVLALDPVSFTFNSNNQKNLGFIAEQVLTVDPRIVTLDESGLPNAVDSDQILPLLTKSIQQLHNGLTDPNASTTSSDGTKTFAGKFFDRLIAWFADRANNIGDFFANRVHTKTLCVGEKDNETCITKSQLDQLLLQSPKPSSNTSENTTSVSMTPTPPTLIMPTTVPTQEVSSPSAGSL